MEDILLLTVEHVVQVSNDVLIAPFLPVDKYGPSLHRIERIKIVKPDNQIIEKNAEFGIPLDGSSRMYILMILNTQKDEIPVDSQIWIKSF